MPNFDQMLDALRDDCDVPMPSAEQMRHLGSRRTTIHRTLGGAATFIALAGLTTGIVLYGGSVSPNAVTPTAGPAAPTTQAPTLAPLVTSSPTLRNDPGKVKPTHSTSVPSTHSSGGTGTATGTALPACVASAFDGAHPRAIDDDATGIVGYDIRLTYHGSASCKLSQPPRISYVNDTGKRVLMGMDSGLTTKPVTMKPGHIVYVTVYEHNEGGVNPPPLQCTKPHVFHSFEARIDGHYLPLAGLSLSFPCGSPVSMEWNLL